MKFSRITRILYIFVWTGIFILSSYIIVKGSNTSFMAETAKYFLKQGSSFIEYFSIQITQKKYMTEPCFFSTWTQGSYLYRLQPEITSDIEKNPFLVQQEEIEWISPVPFLYGESYYEEEKMEEVSAEWEKNKALIEELNKKKNTDFLLKNFYIIDSTTSVDKKLFQVQKLLKINVKMQKKAEPQILIFHTHGGSESFNDSRQGKKEDSVVGVGSVLAQELEKRGYQVIHDETEYDRIDGVIDRNKGYNKAF